MSVDVNVNASPQAARRGFFVWLQHFFVRRYSDLGTFCRHCKPVKQRISGQRRVVKKNQFPALVFAGGGGGECLGQFFNCFWLVYRFFDAVWQFSWQDLSGAAALVADFADLCRRLGDGAGGGQCFFQGCGAAFFHRLAILVLAHAGGVSPECLAAGGARPDAAQSHGALDGRFSNIGGGQAMARMG